MRSYTDKDGNVITVTEDHLATAITIKKALQSQSPRMICSWTNHKKMMLQEGYDDSGSNESYRQMIKKHQQSLGEFSKQVNGSPATDVDSTVVPASKLSSIQEAVGELAFQKREIQLEASRLGKIRREIIDGTLFINEVTAAVREVFSDRNFSKSLNHSFSPITDSDGTRIVACITDWHIGALVDVEGNKYDFEIAKLRIREFTEKLISIATEKKVNRIDVVYMGDMVEGTFMRNSQAYHAEFSSSEQMALGGQLLIELLLKLSEKFVTVYSGFAGNHDRMNQSDKNGNIDGDSAMVIVNKIVKVFVDASKIANLHFVETHHYNARLLDVNGVNIKLVHGDLEKKADTGKIDHHSSRDGVIYDVIVYGHFHHYACIEVGINKFEIRVGSIKGSDDYSEKLGLGSAPSQAVLIVDSNGEVNPVRIGLH